MSNNNFGKLWADYKAKVIPAQASVKQVIETKRAFYGGATMMYLLLTEACSKLSDDKAVEMMNNLKNELDEFIMSVGKGN